MVLLEPSKKEELDMKQIGSLLTAGALALSLGTLPAGAAEAAPALEETAQAARGRLLEWLSHPDCQG